MRGLVEDAVRPRGRGARARAPSTTAPTSAAGTTCGPTLVLGAEDGDPLVAEEQFGPAVPLLPYDAVDEVVARANAGELGLGASVWSADEDRAFAVAARLDAGFTFVNTHNRTGMSLRAPFGGVKRSGWGREYGDEGLLEHVQTCVVHAPGAFRPGRRRARRLGVPDRLTPVARPAWRRSQLGHSPGGAQGSWRNVRVVFSET